MEATTTTLCKSVAEVRNKIIHIVCVPLILTASGALLEHLRFTVGPVKPDLSFYSLLVALLYYVSLDKVAGVLPYYYWRGSQQCSTSCCGECSDTTSKLTLQAISRYRLQFGR